MSTTWVLAEYRRGEDSYQEHMQIIDLLDETLERARKRIRELEKEVAELRAKYQAFHQKQFKPNRKKTTAGDDKVSDGTFRDSPRPFGFSLSD